MGIEETRERRAEKQAQQPPQAGQVAAPQLDIEAIRQAIRAELQPIRAELDAIRAELDILAQAAQDQTTEQPPQAQASDDQEPQDEDDQAEEPELDGEEADDQTEQDEEEEEYQPRRPRPESPVRRLRQDGPSIITLGTATTERGRVWIDPQQRQRQRGGRSNEQH